MVEAQERVGDVVRVADGRGIAVGCVLALRRQQRVRERGRDGREDEEERPREKAADPARLDERRREQHGERLGEHVEAAHVRQLVGDDGVELVAPRRSQQARSTRRAWRRPGPRPTTNARGKPSSIRQSFGGATPQLGGDPVGRGAQERILGEGERPRAEHPEQRPVTEPVDGDRGAERAEGEERCAPLPPDQPADPACERDEEADQERGP